MSINLFDSHCHLQFPQYDADREETIERTLAAGYGMICVGTDLETSKKAIELAEKYSGIWATVGCHPDESGKELHIAGYEDLAERPKIVGIGETGLDYYRTSGRDERENQKDAFGRFLKLAAETKKPLIIHCRDPLRRKEDEASAYDDLLIMLRAVAFKSRGVVHSFAGPFNLARRLLDLGLFLGFNGIITFTDEYDDMVAKVPLDRILIETNSPYLAPVPHRGKRNEPLYVEFVARRIAEIKGASFDEVVEKTRGNTIKLFGLE